MPTLVRRREARQHLPSSSRFRARYDACSARFDEACVGPAREHNKGGSGGLSAGRYGCRRGWAWSQPSMLVSAVLPPAPSSAPTPAPPPPADRLAKAWARESARFDRDYNDRLLGGLVMIRCSVLGWGRSRSWVGPSERGPAAGLWPALSPQRLPASAARPCPSIP